MPKLAQCTDRVDDLVRRAAISAVIASILAVSSAGNIAFADTEETVVQKLVDALKSNDATATASLFTNDAGYAYSLEGALNRGDRFDAWLVSDISGPGSVFEVEATSVDGGTVDALVVWGRAGEANRPARYVFTVVDGKIDSWRMTSR